MTARILDTRHHLLLPDLSMVGSPLDYYQWGALLKSLSGFESYRRMYQGGIRPIDVVEFTILIPDFPRSLAYCVDGIEKALERIGSVPQGAVPEAMAALRGHLIGVTPRASSTRGCTNTSTGPSRSWPSSPWQCRATTSRPIWGMTSSGGRSVRIDRP